MENTTLSNLVVLDEVTGEVKGYLTKDEVKYLTRNFTSFMPNPKTNDENITKSIEELHKYISEEYGSFYFGIINKVKDLKYSFRFIYLCTFMNYKNYICYGNAIGEGKLVKKKDLFEILKLSKAEYFNTVKYLIENNLITEDEEGNIKINKEIAIRGNIAKSKVKGSVRMFDESIRELYNNSKPIEHKKISLLLKILPYVHFDMNILCENPTEDNIKMIKPFNLTRLSNELGYSSTQKLKKGLMELRVKEEKVIMIAKFDNIDMIVINPRIYYRGTRIDKLKAIGDLFSIANKY